mmetsp:Transcript_28063/g.61266  ORF Transcript_28063/g.61266 Transcript_28063/m.61266 type:complete len:780 (-) Transcript_28063:161-2500(-)
MYQRLAEAPVAASLGRWDAAPDLEQFLTSFYQYFEVGGLRGILATQFSHLVSLAFTICFSLVLLFFVDWQALLTCDSEEACREVSLFFHKPFEDLGFGRVVVLCCFCLFFAYWLFNCAAAYHAIRNAMEMSTYYEECLGIASDEILATMSWSEVVSRLTQQQKASPFCIVQDELTALEVANIIMREDNFMVALTNQNALTSRLPPWVLPEIVYTRSVLWNFRTAIFHKFFDQRSRVNSDFLNNPEALALRLRWMGVINLILVIPVLIFVTIYFFMRHTEEFRSHRVSAFQRQWTDYAKWTFREYNELPHQFRARMCHAREAAEAFASATWSSSPAIEAVKRCIKFIAGSILAVLLLLALWDDSPLLYMKIQDKNLLWYLALFGFIFAVADNAQDAGPLASAAELRQESWRSPSTPLRMHTALMRLVRCTHYMPPAWRCPGPLSDLAGGCSAAQRARYCHHFQTVRHELLRSSFVHRIQALLEELLGVVLTPLLLIVYLPEAAPDIVDVVRRTRHASPNLGDWCLFGCLDPAMPGIEAVPMRGLGSSGASHQGAVSHWAMDSERGRVSVPSKLEKSAINFILTHCSSGSLAIGEGAAPQAENRRSIPLQEMAVLAVHGDASTGTSEEGGLGVSHDEDLPEWHAEGPPCPVSAANQKALDSFADGWGYPRSAVRLLAELEEFRRRQLALEAPQRSPYSTLAEDLTRLRPVLPLPLLLPEGNKDEPSTATASEKTASLESSSFLEDEEADLRSCGCDSHFFWLEVLYDVDEGSPALPDGDRQ